MTLQKTIVSYLVFTLVWIAVCIGLMNLFPAQSLFIDKFWLVFGFISGITFIALMVASIGLKYNPEVGVMAIMGSIALKMLFSMGFVLVYLHYTPVNKIVFVINFFSLYFLFSGFEIYCLLRNLRHQNK